jgi:hypothetical protein
MPVARYFLFVGAVLLTLMFVVDAYLPKLPPEQRANAAADLSVIRIHSDRKWPERVVLDTTRPTITPATTAVTEASVAAPASVADLPARVRVREAFAQLTPTKSDQLQPANPRKPDPDPKPQRKHKAVARGYADPPVILVAQQPRFGFFGSSIW